MSNEQQSCCPHEHATEINELVRQRTEYQRVKDYERADAIQQKLRETPYNVEIIDHGAENPSEWIPRKKKEEQTVKRSVVWSSMSMEENMNQAQHDESATPSFRHVPLIICTVDSPKYRERYQETLSFLANWQQQQQQQQQKCPFPSKPDNSSSMEAPTSMEIITFKAVPCNLLDLEKNPTIAVKSIVFEGWKRVLLPFLLDKYSQEDCKGFDFVLIAEDDIRFPNHTSPELIYNHCASAFQSNPEIQLLSLGHAWKGIYKQKQRQRSSSNNNDDDGDTTQLLQFLQRKKHVQAGIHGLTLVALRVPEGIRGLLDILEGAISKQKTHLDQFLFHSPHHNFPIALCDPPLAGWAEVPVTLTKSAMGRRRLGGGRTGHLPPPPPEINGDGGYWIKRTTRTEVVAGDENDTAKNGGV